MKHNFTLFCVFCCKRSGTFFVKWSQCASVLKVRNFCENWKFREIIFYDKNVVKHFMVISRKNYKKAKALKAKLCFYKKFREIKSFATSRFHELFIKNVQEYSVISTLCFSVSRRTNLSSYFFFFFLNRNALKITK